MFHSFQGTRLLPSWLFIPKYFIFSDASISRIVFLISSLDCHCFCIEIQLIFVQWFCILQLSWIHLLILTSFMYTLLGFLHKWSCHLWTEIILFLQEIAKDEHPFLIPGLNKNRFQSFTFGYESFLMWPLLCWGNFFPFLVYWLFFIIKRCYTQKLRPETIKLLQENIGKTFSNINHSSILYYPPPRILEIKAKINKWDLIKIKSFCTTKETIKKVKRQPSEWEKIIANEATDKQLISKIYKQLLQLNSTKINDPIKNGPKI